MEAKGLTVLVIMTALCALVASASAPPTPFMIYGYVSYEDGSECDNPTVNINNTNTSNEWSTEIKTNASYNYYQLMLANGSDVNASEILRFNVTSPTGNQSNITEHTVTQENITDGGLFNFNITLEAETVDTTFTVALPAECDYAIFEPANSTATNVPPDGQNSSTAFYNVTNTGNVNLSIRMQLNATVSNILLKAGTDNDPGGAKEVNTTLVTIFSPLEQGHSRNIWIWSDFSHAIEQQTNKTLSINVTQA